MSVNHHTAHIHLRYFMYPRTSRYLNYRHGDSSVAILPLQCAVHNIKIHEISLPHIIINRKNLITMLMPSICYRNKTIILKVYSM